MQKNQASETKVQEEKNKFSGWQFRQTERKNRLKKNEKKVYSASHSLNYSHT